MKVIALVTLHGRDKDGKKTTTAPGTEIELEDEAANDLIKRGKVAAADVVKAKAAEAAKAEGPKVVKGGDGPKVDTVK